MEPLVSVLVPSYNHSKYVLECLDSIQNQTYKNIELIVHDDGSTDNSVSLISEWILKNEINANFTYDKNQGL